LRVSLLHVLAAFIAAIPATPARADSPAAPLPSSVVAYTSQVAPGTGGATYFLLYSPAITRNGDVAFRAELNGAGTTGTNNRALFRQSGGGPVGLFLRSDSPSPLPGLSWYPNFGDPNAQEIGGTARAGFFATLFDGATANSSLWSEPPGGLRNVAIQGGAAPGVAGATFQTLPIFEQSFDEAGEMLFIATVTGGGTTGANDSGLWLDTGSAGALVAREGDDAPGYPAGSKFPHNVAVSTTLAPGGVVSFLSPVIVAAQQRAGIWSKNGGGLTLVASVGGSLPGLAAGETIFAFSNLSGNRHGEIAFFAGINPAPGGVGGWGLWVTSAGGPPTLVYRRDSGDPGLEMPAVKFVLGDNGILYMLGNYFPPSGPAVHGAYAVGPSGWRPVAQRGQRVANLNAGIDYAAFDQLLANGNGQVALGATIMGPGVSSANNRVLVAHGSDLALHLVGRAGDDLEVAPGIVRTILAPSLTQATAGGPGVVRGFADNGSLAWYASTVGGFSSAILVTGLGVPPPIQLVGLEAVQVVQDWNGSIPLVEGKATYVRAYFESTSQVAIHPALKARAAGGGPELPLSPLLPDDPFDSFAVPGVATHRGQPDFSTEWLLPREWTLGNVELEVALVDRGLDCLEAAGSTANDCKLTASFATVPYPEVKFVSVDHISGGVLQHVSPDQRLELAQRLISAFPISDLVLTASQANWPAAAPPDISSCEVRDEMLKRQYMDGCRDWAGCKTIYYGALLGNRENGCSKIGGAYGAGFLPPDPFAKGRHNHTHEFGHIFGKQHTVDPLQPPLPNGKLPGFCSEVAGAGSPPFPYIETIGGDRRPTLGPLGLGENVKVYGLDTIQVRVVQPEAFFDLMSYCANPGIDLWPAKVTYEFLKNAVETRFFAPSEPPSESPAGGPDVLLVQGLIDPDAGTASLLPFATTPSGPPSPTPDPGPYTLRVLRSGGGIEDLAFAPDEVAGHGGNPTAQPFLFEISSPSTVASIEVREGPAVLVTRAASANAPVVQLTSPNGGEVLDQPTVAVTWTASDADLDPLVFVVQFSADDGSTWTTLETGWTSTSVEIDRTALAGTNLGRFRVQASDGLRTASDASDGSFIVEDNAPVAAIVEPANGQLFYDGQAVVLRAMTLDPEDGALSGAALQWTSSLSGALGSGSPLSIPVVHLAVGIHLVTLSAEDSAGNVATAQVQIRVDQPALIFEDDLESGGTTRWN